MDYKFIKKGSKARYTWKVYDYYSAICRGYGPITYEEKEKRVEVVGRPRDTETKKFVSLEGYIYPDEIEVLVRDEKGEKFYATLEDLDVFAEMTDLSFDELCELRKEISLGSLYLADYRNSFGVDENEVCAYGEGYEVELYEEYGEEWEKYDTPQNFANYCWYCCLA